MDAHQNPPTKVVGRRVAAFLIDLLLTNGLGAALYLVLADPREVIVQKIVDGEISRNATAWINVTFNGSEHSLVGSKAALYFVGMVLFQLLYWVVLPGLKGFTPGKLLLGLRIVKADGSLPPGIGRVFLRQLLFIVDAFPYLVPYLTGFIVALTDNRNQRVGDKVAGTLVVRADAVGQGVAGLGASAPPQGTPWTQAMPPAG